MTHLYKIELIVPRLVLMDMIAAMEDLSTGVTWNDPGQQQAWELLNSEVLAASEVCTCWPSLCNCDNLETPIA